MRLSNKDYKIWLDLGKKLKTQGKLEGKDLEEYNRLSALRREGNDAPEFKPGNDFAWWNKEPTLLKDAVNVKSNYIPGRELDPDEATVTIPGVLRVELQACYGASSTAVDPLNLWARDLYLRMFQKWRSISAYSASDLGIVTIAGNEFVKSVAKIERIYGVVNRYSKLNVNMPTAELLALGITTQQADYIRNHLADYRYDLNMLLKRAQRLCIPKDMSMITNVMSLFGYEYLDHANEKAQIIIFDTNRYGIYSDTELQSGGSVKFVKHSMFGANEFINISDDTKTMFPVLESQLNALIGSDGVQKIYGDLVTWFGQDQMLQFLALPEDYVVVPAYSESILHKLHNSVALPHDEDGTACAITHVVMNALNNTDKTKLQSDATSDVYRVYQCNDNIVSRLAVTGNGDISTIQWQLYTAGDFLVPLGEGAMSLIYPNINVLDSYHYDISDETVTEGILWKYSLKGLSFIVSSTNRRSYLVEGCAFELITKYELFKMTNGNATMVEMDSNYNVTDSLESAVAFAGQFSILDWAPLSYRVLEGVITHLQGDVDVLVPIYSSTIVRAHQAIVLSGLKTDIHVIAGRSDN